jgi:hypothetical protein
MVTSICWAWVRADDSSAGATKIPTTIAPMATEPGSSSLRGSCFR